MRLRKHRISLALFITACYYFRSHQRHIQPFQATAPKILLYITTAASEVHMHFFRTLWPRLLQQSDLLSQTSVVVLSTGDPAHDSEIFAVFAHKPAFALVHALNPGYQAGANLAMSVGVQLGIFDGYDWVIRLNPDVIIVNSSWISDTLRDSHVDAIFVDCRDRCRSGNCIDSQVIIHTDFFAVRPHLLRKDAFNNVTFARFGNAELTATFEFEHILQTGRHRWLPGSGPMNSSCRVRGPTSPVIHAHELYEFTDAFV
jgi:hypothetical protein